MSRLAADTAFPTINTRPRFFFGDTALWLLLFMLALLSLIILYSASNQDTDLVIRHFVRLLIGFTLMFALLQIRENVYRWWAVWFYLLGIGLLGLVLVVGDLIKGSQRWIDLWVIQFQPSELLKVATPLILCFLFTHSLLSVRPWKFMLAVPLVAVPVILIVLQPDLGTAILVGISGLLVLFLAGLGWWWLIGGAVFVVGLSPFLWNMLLPYQQQRLLVFLNPEQDPFGAGYHTVQSKVAIGAGGIWGKGWLEGTQSHLDFVPERATDFVFASFAEEFGFAGVVFLFLIYLSIIVRGIQLALSAPSDFGRLLAGSLSLAFAVYVLINIGMVSGFLPVVGVPLPLISYGGTSAVTSLASFGILMAVSRQTRKYHHNENL